MLFIIWTIITGLAIIFAINVLMYGLEAATKMDSLCTFFLSERTERSKVAEKQYFFKNCLGSSFVIQVIQSFLGKNGNFF